MFAASSSVEVMCTSKNNHVTADARTVAQVLHAERARVAAARGANTRQRACGLLGISCECTCMQRTQHASAEQDLGFLGKAAASWASISFIHLDCRLVHVVSYGLAILGKTGQGGGQANTEVCRCCAVGDHHHVNCQSSITTLRHVTMQDGLVTFNVGGKEFCTSVETLHKVCHRLAATCRWVSFGRRDGAPPSLQFCGYRPMWARHLGICTISGRLCDFGDVSPV